MTLKKRVFCWMLLIAMFATVRCATASPITLLIDISATGPNDPFSASIPPNPVVGSFSVTFDPTLTYHNETSGIMINSLNLPIFPGITPQFSYDPTAFSPQQMILSGTLVPQGATAGTPSFVFSINNSDPASFSEFSWSDAGLIGVVVLHDVTGTVTPPFTPPSPSVPEPGTILLLATGMVTLFAVRQKKMRNRECHPRG